MNVYPLLFKPIPKERIWGGKKLKALFGRDVPHDKPIGESWDLVDLAEDQSVIINGSLAGLTLHQAIERFPLEIMGQPTPPPRFPLFIKLLDCTDVLSVQVHPDAAACRRMGKGTTKTECWYILEAEKGAVIYKGLKPGVTRQEVEGALKHGKVTRLLNRIRVHEGEFYFLPAGTLHSIGAGLLVAEIQTPSDTTFRVFDWNRLDAQGNPRALHITEALASIHFEEKAEPLPEHSPGLLIDSEFFKVEKLSSKKSERIALEPLSMKAIIVIKGNGVIHGEHGSTAFRAGDTLLIPATFHGEMMAEESVAALECLAVTLPEGRFSL